MQDGNNEPDDKIDRETVVHALGEVVLGVLGMMTEQADDKTPRVMEVGGGPIPENKTPEEFMEKMFENAKKLLAEKGQVNPGIFSYKNKTVKGWFIHNNPGGEFIKGLLERIVKNDTPDAYAVIFESWMNEAKKDMPPEMDPEAKEVIVGVFKGRNTFQLIQFFHHDEQEHNKIVFDGDTKKLAGEVKGRLDVTLRNPTNDYIG